MKTTQTQLRHRYSFKTGWTITRSHGSVRVL